ncbi:hypothetical protein LSCM1_04482 [Leishmania martiniquensis]|uniref:Uncharacterized protein n=1 Tax=Leishmania martiniquensis TaxID=1580590 RepID=A0A836GXR0_9TRYP|nr:hypothetical protein LSCM1_04482 [Leishmania martiniquensis]
MPLRTITCARRTIAASNVLLPLVSARAHQRRSLSSPGYTMYTTGAPSQVSSGSPPASAAGFQHCAPGDTSHAGGSSAPRSREGFTEVDLHPPQMPSPQQYASYDAYLNAYDEYLQETTKFLAAARALLQNRLRHLHRAHAGLSEAVRREYFWTFVPFICTLCVHMVDSQHHVNAQITRERLKQRAKEHVKSVKWVSV